MALEQKKYALLIGINEYVSPSLITKKLRFANADAQSMKKVLEDRGWDARVVVDEAATRKRIVRELYNLSLRAKPADKVLIYFAGHGVRDPRGLGHTYWVAYDAGVENLVSDALRLNHIFEYVNDISAQEKIVLLDHCYSGDYDSGMGGDDDGGVSRSADGMPLVTENERDLFPVEMEAIQQISEDRMVILAAARGPAYEADEWGHGMFTKAILDALEDPDADTTNDGNLSLDELWKHLSISVSTMAADKNLEQKPLSSKITMQQLNWAVFEAGVVDFSAEVDVLKRVISDLEMAAMNNFDIRIKLACTDALNEWKDNAKAGLSQDSRVLQIVQALKSIRSSGVTIDSQAKKQGLEDLVRDLGLVET